jgi:hypothetical protein
MPAKKSLGEYDARLAAMVAQAVTTSTIMQAHIEADAKAFAELLAQIKEINTDVKSMLAAKAFAAGVWKALTILAASGVGVALAGLLWRAFH